MTSEIRSGKISFCLALSFLGHLLGGGQCGEDSLPWPPARGWHLVASSGVNQRPSSLQVILQPWLMS